MSNPFKGVEAWKPSTGSGQLPAGDYVVTIDKADASSTSSNGNPQIALELSCDEGYQRDWVTITQNTLRKVVGLAEGAGIALPEDDDIEEGSLRLKQSYVDKLVGRKVGIVVRDEEDRNDALKKWPRVQGYVTPEEVSSDVTPPAAGNAFQRAATEPSAADERIPF